MASEEKPRTARNREKDRLLKLVPEDAVRIKVLDRNGDIRWRHLPDDLEDFDKIQTKKDGTPVFMRGAPGRRKIASIGDVNPKAAKLVEQKEKMLRRDALINAVRGRPESEEVLQYVMVGLAEEAASIAFERKRAERENKETSSLSARRVQALKATVDTWLKRKEQIATNSIDLNSNMFQVLMGYVFETFRGCLQDARVGEDSIKVVFAHLSKRVGSDEWKKEAKNRIKRGV
jgi:hypothetical protein